MEKDKQLQKITEIIKENLKGVLQIEVDILAEALYQKGCRITPCAIGFDYIDGYKKGFKEGVIALKTQLKERIENQEYLLLPTATVKYMVDEICKGLEGDNG